MKRNERGTAIVEFAIILPLVLFLFFVIAEFAILLYDQQVITNASRDGARAGTRLTSSTPPYLTAAQIITTTQSHAMGHLITFGSNVAPTVCVGDCASPANCTGYDVPSGGLKVTVNYTYTFGVLPNLYGVLFGTPGESNLVLRASTTMRCE